METTNEHTGATLARRPRPATLWALQAGLSALGIGAAVGAVGLGVWTPRGPGPGFFPLVLGLGILGLTVAWFVQSLRDADAAGATRLEMDLRGVGITLGSLVVLGLLLDVIGFQTAMFLFLLFHLRLRGRVGWLVSVSIALVGSVGSYVLFNNVLQVGLPVGSVPPFTWIGI